MDAWSTTLGNETMHILCSALPDIAKALNRRQKSVDATTEKVGEVVRSELSSGWCYKAHIPAGKGNVVIIFEK